MGVVRINALDHGLRRRKDAFSASIVVDVNRQEIFEAIVSELFQTDVLQETPPAASMPLAHHRVPLVPFQQRPRLEPVAAPARGTSARASASCRGHVRVRPRQLRYHCGEPLVEPGRE